MYMASYTQVVTHLHLPQLHLPLLMSIPAIRQLVHLGDMNPEAEETAAFIEKMNDLFDVFNCFGSRLKTPHKRPVYIEDVENILSVSNCCILEIHV